MLKHLDESDDDSETEVAMGECDELLLLSETTLNEMEPLSALRIGGQDHIQLCDETLESNFLNAEVDDGNDDAAIDDDDDDEDDDYEINGLDSAVGGILFPTHNKKSDKTKWCEREVRDCAMQKYCIITTQTSITTIFFQRRVYHGFVTNETLMTYSSINIFSILSL